MASVNFLEEALSTDVESVVNEVMGSLQNQSVPSEKEQDMSNLPSNDNIGNEEVLNASKVNVNGQKFAFINSVAKGKQTTTKDSLGTFQHNTLLANTSNSSISSHKSSSTNFIGHITNVNQAVNQKTREPVKIICQNSTQNITESDQSIILPNAQKTVPVISPHVIGNQTQDPNVRGGAPGLTLQSISALRPGHFLLKTENGQYQLLRVGSVPTQSVITTLASQLCMAMPNTSKVTSVGASLLRKTVLQQQPLTEVSIGQMVAPMSTGNIQEVTSASALPFTSNSFPLSSLQSTPSMTSKQQQENSTLSQKPVDNAKVKCRNFLANLLDLSSRETKTVEKNVRILIQELIDMHVEPEQFCDRLEKLLNASPQPCLIAFLKKSLPLLRESLVSKELVINGIKPPILQSSIVTTTHLPQVPIVRKSFARTCDVTRITAPSPISVTQQNKTQFGASELNQSVTMPPPQFWPVTSKSMLGVSKPATMTVLQNISVQGNETLNRSPFSKPIIQSINKATIFPKAGPKSSLQSTMDIDKISEEDDLNDVIFMGGVNLAEEDEKNLGIAEIAGFETRQCKDEYFAAMGPLQSYFKQIAAHHGLDEPAFDLSALVSHAVQKRLQTLVEKLAIIAEHKIDFMKFHQQYEVSQDVRGQLKFLGEMDRVGKKRREDSEREILLRAAKSRSKTEDPELAKLKAKAKELQRIEMEELRQREANLTALQAIGTRKKPKLGDLSSISVDLANNSNTELTSLNSGRNKKSPRSRLKRVNFQDVIFLLEQERDTCHSTLIYKCYLK